MNRFDMNRIQSLIRSYRYDEQPSSDGKPGPVVTVARDYGSGSGEVAAILAQRLNVPLYDQQILEEISGKFKLDVNILSRLDERTANQIEGWILNLLSKNNISEYDYVKKLVLVLLGITREGGVIMGRGAHLILDGKEAFRLRLTGSQRNCINRIMTRDGIPEDEARAKMFQINEERNNFVKKLFANYPSQRAYYDLMINTDRLHPRQAADLAVDAMERMGFDVPARKKSGSTA